MLELLSGSALAVLVALHLVTVYVAATAPLLSAWLAWRASRRATADALVDGVARDLARLALMALTAGIALGLVLLGIAWFVGRPAYLEALASIPHSRYGFAVAELLFAYACLGAYVGLWRRMAWHRGWHALLAVAGATNLLYHFPALFVVISLLATRPELATEPVSFRALLVEPEALARWAHHVLAGVTVAAAALFVVVLRLARRRTAGIKTEMGAATSRSDASPTTDATAIGLTIWGGRLALVAASLQLPVGLVLLLVAPPGSRRLLTGADLITTSSFVLGLLAALGLLHHLAAIALGDVRKAVVRRSVLLLALVLVTMVLMRQRTREAAYVQQLAIGPSAASAHAEVAAGAEVAPRRALAQSDATAQSAASHPLALGGSTAAPTLDSNGRLSGE